MSLDLLQCPVCCQRYSDPHMLPGCGHSFCRGCIEQIAPNTLTFGTQRSQLKCPICRDTFRANTHRPNFALRQLLADANWTPDGHLGAGSVTTDVPALGTMQKSCIRDVEETGGADTKKAQTLRSLGVPPALAEVLVEEDRQIGLRIFILDNSGSTSAFDGHRYETRRDYEGAQHTVRIDCSRWEEIKHMALEQAEWAAVMGTPCEFRLLNPGPLPLREGIDFARFNCSDQSPEADLLALRRMLEKSSPGGHTPIAERLNEVHARIKQDHAELTGRGQRVVVVLATDGCPTLKGSGGRSTNEDKRRVVECIKRLTTELPVFMVVRLTCDEDDVIQFYNELDSEIELNLEVLDDIEGEAKEIAANGNGWLAYTPMIHKIREGGTFMKLFDLLDERPLTPVEIALLSQMLLRPEGEDSCSFRGKAINKGSSQDSEMLFDVLEEYHKEAALVYNPLRRCMTKPVDIILVGYLILPALTSAKRAFAFCVWGSIKPLFLTQGYAAAKDADDQKNISVRDVKFLPMGASGAITHHESHEDAMSQENL